MFSFFRRAAEKVGTELINEAISEFESIAARIEAGVAHNRENIANNQAQIEALHFQNTNLEAVAARGESVAAKLRGLLS